MSLSVHSFLCVEAIFVFNDTTPYVGTEGMTVQVCVTTDNAREKQFNITVTGTGGNASG